MGKKAKVGKNRQDKFYQLAKEQGFRSRASFKLVQLNKRYDFLSNASRGVLDLCAAPGGWMQVARKHMPMGAPCIGIDLVPIRAVAGCVGLTGDITHDSTRSDLRRALREAGNTEEKVDAVLNDGSPNMGKAWLQDAYTQSELTLAALRLAAEFLAQGGSFVTKVFRSNDYNSLLFVMHQLFERVMATKPTASRAESAEIYVMCAGFKAPKSIDPRLLNPKYVFKDMGTPDVDNAEENKPDLFLNTVMKDMKKQKRHRGGYEDGQFILFKKTSILEFCETARPVAMMVESHQFSFEPSVMKNLEIPEDDSKVIARFLEAMPETTAEVLSCCEDLKVLARREFKLLLKWRATARNELRKEGLLDRAAQNKQAQMDEEQDQPDDAQGPDSKENNDMVDVDENDNESSDPDAVLEEEMKKARADASAVEKRKKRKANKARNAIQRKIDMKIIMPDDEGGESANAPDGLFSLATAKRLTKHGVSLTDVPIDDTNELQEDGYEGDEEQPVPRRLPRTLEDVDETWEKKNGEIEEDINRWYKVYLTRKKKDKNGTLLKESKERKRITKRKALREAMEKKEEGGDLEETDGPSLVVDSSESSDGEQDVEDFNDGGSKMKNSREAALWFSQPMFQDVLAMSSDEDSDAEMGDAHTEVDGQEGAEEENEAGDGENIHAAARREARRAAEKKKQERDVDGDGVEIVPQDSLKKDSDDDDDDDGENSDSSFHSSDYDTDEKAEMVAIGRRMRQSKTEASDVLDEAYNRYTFDDPMELPRWFADQDHLYRERHAPVTKEQVDEMKEYIKSLEAAPTKKEAEAKARRRARASKKMQEMKTKANSIAEQADVPVTSKMKAIEDLYKQAMKGTKSGKKNKKKVYQVVRPNGRMTVGKNQGKGRRALKGARTTLVDKRLKSDKRGIEKAKKKAKGGKR